MKYEKMLTFTTKYNRHNVRYMGHLILKTTDATVTAADFVSYGGTYELNILN